MASTKVITAVLTYKSRSADPNEPPMTVGFNDEDAKFKALKYADDMHLDPDKMIIKIRTTERVISTKC